MFHLRLIIIGTFIVTLSSLSWSDTCPSDRYLSDIIKTDWVQTHVHNGTVADSYGMESVFVVNYNILQVKSNLTVDDYDNEWVDITPYYCITYPTCDGNQTLDTSVNPPICVDPIVCDEATEEAFENQCLPKCEGDQTYFNVDDIPTCECIDEGEDLNTEFNICLPPTDGGCPIELPPGCIYDLATNIKVLSFYDCIGLYRQESYSGPCSCDPGYANDSNGDCGLDSDGDGIPNTEDSTPFGGVDSSDPTCEHSSYVNGYPFKSIVSSTTACNTLSGGNLQYADEYMPDCATGKYACFYDDPTLDDNSTDPDPDPTDPVDNNLTIGDTNSTATSDDNSTNYTIDFTPATSRLDNISGLIGKTNTKIDKSNEELGDINTKLVGLNTGLGGKLDGIKEAIEGIGDDNGTTPTEDNSTEEDESDLGDMFDEARGFITGITVSDVLVVESGSMPPATWSYNGKIYTIFDPATIPNSVWDTLALVFKWIAVIMGLLLVFKSV